MARVGLVMVRDKLSEAAQQSDPQAGGVVIAQHFRQLETPSSLEVRAEGEVDQGVE